MAATTAQPAPAAQATPAQASPAGRRLKDLPNTKVTFYEVQGKDGKAIEKSLKALRTDKATKQFSPVSSNWNVAATVTRVTTDGKCSVKAVSSQFSADVELPRLANEKAATPEVLSQWRTYVDGLDAAVADNFFYVYGQLPALEQSLAGMECGQADKAWSDGIERIKADAMQRSAAAQAAAVPTARK